jgi:hypothetical protein
MNLDKNDGVENIEDSVDERVLSIVQDSIEKSTGKVEEALKEIKLHQETFDSAFEEKFYPAFSMVPQWLEEEGIPVTVKTSDDGSWIPGLMLLMWDTPNWLPRVSSNPDDKPKLDALNETLCQRFMITKEQEKNIIRVVSKFSLCNMEEFGKLDVGPSDIISICLSKGANVSFNGETFEENGRKGQWLMVTIRDFFTLENMSRETVFRVLQSMIITKRLIVNVAYPERE